MDYQGTSSSLGFIISNAKTVNQVTVILGKQVTVTFHLRLLFFFTQMK